MSAWENNLVSSGMLQLSSLQLHRTGSQNGSMFCQLPACSGGALSWAVPPSWAALTEPPLPLMSRSTLGLSPAHSPSHVCPSHQQHSLAIPPPMCDFSVSSSSAPSLCPCHRRGQTRALESELQSGLPGCWGSTLTQPPSLASSALTDFQGYSCCRPGMLLDFWQLFSRGSCFAPGSNDGICVQYQENVNFL